MLMTAAASSGLVVGLSASRITSGLAALGGEMIASGGGGMVLGLRACTGIGLVAVGACGAVAWAITNEIRQLELQNCYNAFVNHWRHVAHYQGP